MTLHLDATTRVAALAIAGLIVCMTIPAIRERFGWALVVLLVVVARPGVLGGPVTFAFISGISMEPTLHTGDFAVLLRQERYAAGDVVAYHPSQASDGMIIHRIVGGDDRNGFLIRGDNRTTDDFDRPTAKDLVGRTVVVLPSVGWFFAGLRMPLLLGLVVALVAMWVAWDLLYEPRKEKGLT